MRARRKQFEARYPDDYPDQKLAGKTYNFTVEVQGIKEKKLPELNDEFVKDAAGAEAPNPAASRRWTSFARRSAKIWMRRRNSSNRRKRARKFSPSS